MCYQKWCLLLPEAVFAACINSHYILSHYFFYASCRHQLTEPLKEQMYWRNASICVCVFFVTVWGCLSYGFSSQRLICFPREIYFHERRKLRQITTVRPWSQRCRFVVLLYMWRKSPQLQNQLCFNPSLILSQREKLQTKPNFSLSIACAWLQLFIFSL